MTKLPLHAINDNYLPTSNFHKKITCQLLPPLYKYQLLSSLCSSQNLTHKNKEMGLNSNNRVDHFDGHEMNMMRIHTHMPLEIHTVHLPPHQTTLQKLKNRFCEIFFPDDPFFRFKNQNFRTKLLLGIQYLFPIFLWAPHYNLKLLRSDVISGLTIASLAIPQVPKTFLSIYIHIYSISVHCWYLNLVVHGGLVPWNIEMSHSSEFYSTWVVFLVLN